MSFLIQFVSPRAGAKLKHTSSKWSVLMHMIPATKKSPEFLKCYCNGSENAAEIVCLV